MEGSACPHYSLTSVMGTPAASALDANVCRKAWKPVSVTLTLGACGAGYLGQRHNAVGVDGL